jgi:hypothetical protein
MRKSAQVIRTLKARASSRKSSQCVRLVVFKKRKDEGKTLGKPIDERPFSVIGR